MIEAAAYGIGVSVRQDGPRAGKKSDASLRIVCVRWGFVPICDGCRSEVERVTIEVEDALCELCLEIERFDRRARAEADHATRLAQAPRPSPKDSSSPAR